MNNKKPSLEDIVSLCKRRGFVFQSSEIYGGLAGFYDYGPLGVELANNLKTEWWNAVVKEQDNIYGVDGAIIQNRKLWEASGHVKGFTDPLVDCKNCGYRHRADHIAKKDTNDLVELETLLTDVVCPNCGKKALNKPRVFNMMMKTWLGPLEDDNSLAYLRPETAGSIFTNFENVRETMRAKLPFGIAQIGKVFRNEISPRDFIFRVRELEQMEIQYFINKNIQDEVYENWKNFAWDFLIKRLGIDEKNLEWHEHSPEERAHYAAKAHDIYFKYPFGSKELWGTHNRTDFDLSSHSKASGKDLGYFDDQTKQQIIPYVIESSVGLGRMFLAVITNAYDEDEINGEKRIVLKIKPEIAPVKVAVFPLLKNKPELVERAREVYEMLKENSAIMPELHSLQGGVVFDDNGNIGKRYRRQDEIGTPKCVTIDFDTLQDGTVTVRDRDTTKQTRVKIDELIASLE